MYSSPEVASEKKKARLFSLAFPFFRRKNGSPERENKSAKGGRRIPLLLI